MARAPRRPIILICARDVAIRPRTARGDVSLRVGRRDDDQRRSSKSVRPRKRIAASVHASQRADWYTEDRAATDLAVLRAGTRWCGISRSAGGPRRPHRDPDELARGDRRRCSARGVRQAAAAPLTRRHCSVRATTRWSGAESGEAALDGGEYGLEWLQLAREDVRCR